MNGIYSIKPILSGFKAFTTMNLYRANSMKSLFISWKYKKIKNLYMYEYFALLGM